MRNGLLADQGDVLAFMFYLSLEGLIYPESLPKYMSAVSRYQYIYLVGILLVLILCCLYLTDILSK